ncbi:MAG: DUF932 domain-containing protein [Prevotella sp.]|jgi:hypothetical protein|nr:DUF932 domain-containing protein [Prevotella sp.]
MEQRQLNFAEKSVQVLTLEELEKSYHENLTTGEPVGGIYHFALIQQVLEIFEERGLKPVVQEIFAAANRDSKRPGVTLLPQLEEKFGERAIEAHLLRRVYANIEIRSDETDDIVTCLAVAYHQKGIQLGIGPMVKVCHNQTILGAQDVVSNYTCYSGQSRKDKYSLEMVMNRAQRWADDYEPFQKVRRERMAALKSAQMDRNGMLQLIGVLVEKRILHDTNNDVLRISQPYPLNSSQINETSEQLIALMRHDEPISYWDAYQQLNTVLKPSRMDIPQVLPQSLALFETMYENIKN